MFLTTFDWFDLKIHSHIFVVKFWAKTFYSYAFFQHPKLLAFWLWQYDMPPPSHSHSGYLPTSTKWRNTKKLVEQVQVPKHLRATQTDSFRDVSTERERGGQRRKGKPRSQRRQAKKSLILWDTLFPVYDLMREKWTQLMWSRGRLVTFRSFMKR